MTRTTNARLAGFAFLFYIAVGVAAMVIGARTGAADTSARLALIAQHRSEAGLTIVLAMLTGFSALVLGIALYGITRDEDHDLALFALSSRACEGVLGAFPITTLGLLWLATTRGSADAPDAPAAAAIAAFLLKLAGWKTIVGATFFAVGSAVFSWLMLRGRVVPGALAWLGVVASLLLVAGLPLQLAGVLSGVVAQVMWLPMAAFEIPVAIWLIVKGASAPAPRAPI
jgi:hypothetical protein